MNSAYDRDAIIALALEHLMRFAKRAAFMVVKKNEIRGFDITGDLTNREAARSFWVPLSTPCSLCRAAHDKQIHLGPLGRSPADSVLSAALGGRPERALIIPIVIQDRTVGILYADRLDVEVPPWSRLERLAQTMAENLAKILRRGRLG
jgi:GAF domain-containing protein